MKPFDPNWELKHLGIEYFRGTESLLRVPYSARHKQTQPTDCRKIAAVDALDPHRD